MDMNMIYAIVVVIGVISFAFGVNYLEKKEYITPVQLNSITNMFGLGVEFIDELDLKNETQIMNISQIVMMSLKYAIDISGTDKEKVKLTALEYSEGLCGKFKIKLTDNRISLMSKLIDAGLENKFADKFILK